ncbi:universal stress protein [Roseibium litorale]|uniref:Universal stress protein n=1 Tax=Roseibium litorale TaxID=2803841 RepID=A0ABR9CP85_9HYPH|nr:universal stress protein [Roseibium litorale]MBD8892687.1 universal stress protein [Roseibium litorale]
MSFKTILAVAELGISADTIEMAIAIARAFEAHLTLLPVGEVPNLPFYGSGAHGYIEIWAKECDQQKAELTAFAARIEERLSREGISFDVRPSLSTAAHEDDLVARHAIYCDLAVLLRSAEKELSTMEKNAIDGALFDSGRPVLFIPNGFKADRTGARVAIAWNSRREAARAVSEALPFLQTAEEITLLMVDPVVGDNDHGEDPGSDIATVLARHGLKITVQSVVSADRPVSCALQDSARELGVDLIVMGAYGHSRLRENILGGTTREMLEQTTIPLFLSH